MLEALKSSGKLVAFISTKSGTYKSPWCRVMTKNPGGESFFPSTVYNVRCVFSGCDAAFPRNTLDFPTV